MMTTIAPTNDSFIDFKSSPSNANSSVCFTSPILEPVSPDVQPAIWMLYLFTSICSVLGNLLVILVQIFGRQSSRCIRKYLNNLAVSDITLALMSMPFMYSNIVLGHWTYPHFLCPVAQFAQLLTSFTTSSTLSIIGIERYIITLHPLSPGASWLKSKGSWLLISTWFLGAAYAYVPTSHTAVEDFILNGDLYQQCSYRFSLSPHKLRFIIVLNFVLTFLLPLVIITFSYVAIIRHLKEHHDFTVLYTNQYRQNQCQLMTIQTHPPLVRRNSCSFKNRSKTIKMIFAVIVLYCLCWFPLKLLQFLLNFGILSYCTETEFYLMLYGYIACHWFAMANSLINPCIYSFMSKSFRDDLKRLSSSWF